VSDTVAEVPIGTGGPVLGRLSTRDRFLPAWILAAMAAGPIRDEIGARVRALLAELVPRPASEPRAALRRR
jgi:hypothetical protein